MQPLSQKNSTIALSFLLAAPYVILQHLDQAPVIHIQPSEPAMQPPLH